MQTVCLVQLALAAGAYRHKGCRLDPLCCALGRRQVFQTNRARLRLRFGPRQMRRMQTACLSGRHSLEVHVDERLPPSSLLFTGAREGPATNEASLRPLCGVRRMQTVCLV